MFQFTVCTSWFARPWKGKEDQDSAWHFPLKSGLKWLIPSQKSGTEKQPKLGSRPGKPNQRKARVRGVFVNSERFFSRENKENSQKPHNSRIAPIFVNSSGFFSRKTLRIQPACDSAGLSLVWFAGSSPDKHALWHKLFTKNCSEITIFQKLRISRVIQPKSRSFPEILRVQSPSKITKKNF